MKIKFALILPDIMAHGLPGLRVLQHVVADYNHEASRILVVELIMYKSVPVMKTLDITNNGQNGPPALFPVVVEM